MKRSCHFVKRQLCRIVAPCAAFLALAGMLSGAALAALPGSTLHPAGPVARAQLNVFNVALAVITFIFVVVGSLLLYTIIRFRHRPGDREPAQIEGNTTLEIIWTAIPVILLIFIAVPTVMVSFDLHSAAAEHEETLEVRVVGYQWWWSFEYPDLGIVTANELRIPTGTRVNLTLESNDVIHSFWVPRLAGKVDLVPGRVNTMWIQADEPGVYYGQCAEYCGVSHANMRLRVQAMPPDEFEAWVAARQAGQVAEASAHAPLSDRAAAGRDYFVNSACAACHNVDGTAASGTVGPDLTDIGSRTTIAAGLLENTPENMAAWLRNPQAVKPGALMPNLNLDEETISALVAYLASLK